MAALSDNFHGWKPVEGSGLFETSIGVGGADEFYRGALGVYSSGKLIVVPADATESCGLVTQRLTATAADQIVTAIMRGIIWFMGAANLTTANQGALFSPGAGSDNPADLVTAATAAQPGAIGRLLVVDATAVSGYLDFSDRSAVVNTA